jgi:hypothetical protein
MHRVKGLFDRMSAAFIAVAMIAIAAFLQLTVHDPHHVLLTVLGSWGLLSLPVGLLVGHVALGED